MRDLVEAVGQRPGISLRDALAGMRHHYSSSAVARSTIARQIQDGTIKGIRVERDGRALLLYPATESRRTA